LHAAPAGGHTALGFLIKRDSAFAPGGGSAAAALALDQLADGVPTGADDLGGAADGGGDDVVSNHHDPQILSFAELLHDHIIGHLARGLDCLLHFIDGAKVHADARALFAAG